VRDRWRPSSPLHPRPARSGWSWNAGRPGGRRSTGGVTARLLVRTKDEALTRVWRRSQPFAGSCRVPDLRSFVDRPLALRYSRHASGESRRQQQHGAWAVRISPRSPSCASPFPFPDGEESHRDEYCLQLPPCFDVVAGVGSSSGARRDLSSWCRADAVPPARSRFASAFSERVRSSSARASRPGSGPSTTTAEVGADRLVNGRCRLREVGPWPLNHRRLRHPPSPTFDAVTPRGEYLGCA